MNEYLYTVPEIAKILRVNGHTVLLYNLELSFCSKNCNFFICLTFNSRYSLNMAINPSLENILVIITYQTFIYTFK